MHALLDWEGSPTRLPSDLLGLTDKPPGSYAPGDRWSPSVGCGPVEGFWALWWTQPDEQASRSGMVRSEVALWRLDEIGGVNDLRPVMESLGGHGLISLPPAELLGAVAEALLSASSSRPVLPDLDVWPGVIAALWARLWPEARRVFSARVAISPPQGGESVAPPWIFGIPPERALQWSGYRVIAAAPSAAQPSRAAAWLVATKDPTLEEVLAACSPLPADLGALRRVARAADRLERLREAPNPQHALNLLRTLLTLARGPDAAVTLKKEASNALVAGFLGETSSFVSSLANLDLSQLPEGGSLESALGSWIRRWAADLSLEEASRLLNMLSPDRATSWWQEGVRVPLSAELSNPEPRWAKAALQWLGLPNAAGVLRTLLPATEGVEQCLLDVTSGVEPVKATLHQIQHEAAQRGWSRIHAWAAMNALPPREAFQAQRAFLGDPSAGLAFLVERLPGPVVVEEAVSLPDAQLVGLVARRTKREPNLLRSLDAGQPGWRALWAAHVAAGGVRWPPDADRNALGRALLDAVLEGDEPEGLVAALAEDQAEIALDHPKRAALWEVLSSAGRTALLPRVAEALVRRCDAGRSISTVEHPLSEAIASWARRTRPSARVVAALLKWNVQVSEEEFIRWLDGPKRSEWTSVAYEVGQAVLSRGWKRAAEAIYDRRYVTELRLVAEACQELLSSWQRWVLAWILKPRIFNNSDDAPLVHRIAELGANLAPDGLDDLWERAGGERKRLPRWGSPDARWREAARLAQNGSLKGGLRALVKELRVDAPYNGDLHELETILVERR